MFALTWKRDSDQEKAPDGGAPARRIAGLGAGDRGRGGRKGMQAANPLRPPVSCVICWGAKGVTALSGFVLL